MMLYSWPSHLLTTVVVFLLMLNFDKVQPIYFVCCEIGQFLSIFWLRKIKFRLKHGKCPIFEDINQMNGWLAPDLIGQFVTRNCEARPPVCLESTWLWLTIQNPSFSSTSSYWGWGGAHWKTSKKDVWLKFIFSNIYSLLAVGQKKETIKMHWWF